MIISLSDKNKKKILYFILFLFNLYILFYIESMESNNFQKKKYIRKTWIFAKIIVWKSELHLE